MKVKPPKGVTSVSHDGVQYDVGDDGTFDVDDNALATHAHFIELGFVLEESEAYKAFAAKKDADAKAAVEAAEAAAKKEADDKAAAEKKAADEKAAAEKKAAAGGGKK
jgi:hypothetical protein